MKRKVPLEKATEDKSRLYALENYHVKSIKLNLMGNRSWPDRIFLLHHAPAWWVEFKRIGEKPTPIQQYTNEYLRSIGYDASIIYTYEEFVTEFHRRHRAKKVGAKAVHEKSRPVSGVPPRGRSPS